MAETEITRQLAVALHDAGRALRDRGEVGAGLERLPPTEIEVLRQLMRRPGIRVADVAEALALAPSNVSAAVSSLGRRGLLRREPDPDDRRSGRLHPTDRARSDHEEIEAAWGRLVAEALERLSVEQREALVASVDALTALVAELGGARARLR